MSSEKKQGNVFTFRLDREHDQDIIDYIRNSNESISLTCRNLLRNAFDRSMDFEMYKRLMEKMDSMEQTIQELKKEGVSPSAVQSEEKQEETEAEDTTASSSSPKEEKKNNTDIKKSIKSVKNFFENDFESE